MEQVNVIYNYLRLKDNVIKELNYSSIDEKLGEKIIFQKNHVNAT